MYTIIIKPALDITVALTTLIVLSPIFIIVLILLLINNRGKAFFFQERPGLKGKIFKVIKFKTMNDKKDSNGDLLADKERLTTLGTFIRKTSLDELPQLINVLKGNMSLVGPRPLLPEYLPLYSNYQKQRHLVKPGITGWAQVNGRNAISWTKKFELDVWYVQNMSIKLDLKIFFKTITKVLKSEGINAVNRVTIDRFTGKN